MKSGLVCLACLLGAFSLAPAFERTIILPDSFGGVLDPTYIAVNPVTNRLYVAGYAQNRIVVIDGSTHQRVGAIELPRDAEAEIIVCNPVTNKLYVSSYVNLLVVDCSTGRVVQTITIGDGYDCIETMAVDPTSGKLYCHTCSGIYSGGPLLVVDGYSDSVIATVPTSWAAMGGFDERYWLTVDRARNVLYCPCECEWSEEVHIDFVDMARDSVVASVSLDECEFFGLAFDSIGGRLFAAVDHPATSLLLVIDPTLAAVVDSIELWPGYSFIDLCYSAATDRVYCLTDEGYTLIVDPAARCVEGWFGIGNDDGVRLGLHPDGTLLYCAGDHHVVVQDCLSNNTIARITMGYLTDLAVNPRTGLAYCVDDLGDLVRVLERDGTLVTDVWTGYLVGSVAVDNRRDRLYMANLTRNSVLLLDAASSEVLAELPVGGTPRALCLNPDYPRLYCTDSCRQLTVIDLDRAAVETTLSVGTDVRTLRYNEAVGKLYAVSCAEGVVSVIDGTTNAVTATVPVGGRPRDLCVDRRTGRLFCAVRDSLLVLDGYTDTVVVLLPVGKGPLCLGIDETARRLFCGTADSNGLTVVDADSLKAITNVGNIGASPAVFAVDSGLGRCYCLIRDSIAVVDCRSCSVTMRIPLQHARSVALAMSANALFVVEERPYRVRAIDALRGTFTSSWDTLPAPLFVFCGDGPTACVTSTESRVYLLDPPVLDQPLSSPTGPTHLKSELTLLGTRAATVHDITGRRVADFSPGRNDLSRLPAGIYFIRRDGERATAKVVVTR